jgi:hypothetical protein
MWCKLFYARHPPGRLTVEKCRVNARPGLALQRDGETVMVVAFSVQSERIKPLGGAQPGQTAALGRQQAPASHRP